MYQLCNLLVDYLAILPDYLYITEVISNLSFNAGNKCGLINFWAGSPDNCE